MRHTKLAGGEIEVSELMSATDTSTERPAADPVLIAVDENDLVRNAVAELLDSATGAPIRDLAAQAEARIRVLDLFSRADVTPELSSIVAGIGHLYERGYDNAADHMEMSHWGLPHHLT